MGIPFLQQLRYGLAGTVLLMSLAVACPSSVGEVLRASDLLDAGLVLVLSLVLGSLVYATHRAVLYPVIYRIFLIGFCAARRDKWSWAMVLPWPSRLELDLDFNRWQKLDDRGSVQKRMNECVVL